MKSFTAFMLNVGLLSFFFVGFAIAAPGINPDHVHFSWQNDPSTTITGMWRTQASVTNTVMEYETGGNTQSVNGSTYSYPEGDGILHIAEATGLTPNTAYNVRVGDGAGNWSGWEAIDTAPAPIIPAAIIAAGPTTVLINRVSGLFMRKFDILLYSPPASLKDAF